MIAFMKEICTYILYSETLNKYYVGSCQESLEERILKHNSGYYGKTTFTSTTNDWVLYFKIATQDYSQAIRIERKIKSMKSRIYIENLKKYPEMAKKLIENI